MMSCSDTQIAGMPAPPSTGPSGTRSDPVLGSRTDGPSTTPIAQLPMGGPGVRRRR